MVTSRAMAYVGALCVLWSWGSGEVWAKQLSCRGLFGKGAYTKAADCFLTVGAALGKGSGLSQEQKIRKGRHLLNGVLALRKAADGQKQISRKAYLRWRATQVLKQYIDEKLYESAARKQAAQLSLHQLTAAIGYATLTLVAPGNAELAIKGYKFAALVRGNWSQKLRPGRYQVTITATDSKHRSVRDVYLLPNQARVVRLDSISPRRAAPRPTASATKDPHQTRRAVGWVILGVGGALTITGGVMIGVAFGVNGEIDELLDRWDGGLGNFDVEDTRRLTDAEGRRDDAALLGTILGGIGLGVVATGALIVGLSMPIKTPGGAPSAGVIDARRRVTLRLP